ncbi:MAG: Rrf2 family transcriptional regulator, partial [Eggerthellaceae bacterium]|nr:Rrf2 family transcriptional regulator [Eggerthellaceae bacterium]
MKDEKLPMAIHMLIMVSESKVPLSSERIAESVGTNAAHIRKLAASLKHAGIIESRQGAAGFKLAQQPRDLNLLEVYRAVHDGADVEAFDLHRNPNDECIVGRHIRPVLSGLFAGISQAAARELESVTLADCISTLA